MTCTWTASSLQPVRGEGAQAKELADGTVLVRSGRDPDGGWLQFTPAEWDAFLGGVRNGEFERKGSSHGK